MKDEDFKNTTEEERNAFQIVAKKFAQDVLDKAPDVLNDPLVHPKAKVAIESILDEARRTLAGNTSPPEVFFPKMMESIEILQKYLNGPYAKSHFPSA